jgi:hypothetical protein
MERVPTYVLEGYDKSIGRGLGDIFIHSIGRLLEEWWEYCTSTIYVGRAARIHLKTVGISLHYSICKIWRYIQAVCRMNGGIPPGRLITDYIRVQSWISPLIFRRDDRMSTV